MIDHKNISENEFIKQVLKYYTVSANEHEDLYSNALFLIDFVNGKQWTDMELAKRQSRGRPALVLNKLRKYIKQLVGEWQQARQIPKYVSLSSDSSTEGANIRNGILYSILNNPNSSSHEAFDNAYEDSLTCGIGYFRIDYQYKNDLSFQKEIILNPIENIFSVYPDPYNHFKSWNYVGITHNKSKHDLQIEFGLDSVENIPSYIGDESIYFNSSEVYKILEFFFVESKKQKLILFDNGMSELESNLNKEDLKYSIDERDITEKIIYHTFISGDRILKKIVKYPSNYLTIIPTYGYSSTKNNKTEYISLISDAIDAQRKYNVARTFEAEQVALASHRPVIMSTEQANKKIQKSWETAHLTNKMVLTYTHKRNQPRPERLSSLGVPSEAMAAGQSAEYDIQDTVGRYRNTMGAQSNVRSGRAMLFQSEKSDSTTYQFLSNLLKSITWSGVVLETMFPKVYNSKMDLIFFDNKNRKRTLELNTKKYNSDGTPYIFNDLNNDGQYNVIPLTSPDFKTKRLETIYTMLDFLNMAPSTFPVIGPRLAKLADWPDSTEIAEEILSLYKNTEK